MLKRNSGFEDSDSDTEFYYSFEEESSDSLCISESLSQASRSRSTSRGLLNNESLNLGNNLNQVKSISRNSKENLLIDQTQTLLPTKSIDFNNPQSLSPNGKKRIFDVYIMSTNSGAVLQKEPKEEEKRKRSLKFSFKKKKRGDKIPFAEGVASGPESDISGPSAPSSPCATLERRGSSPIKNEATEYNFATETRQTHSQIDKEKPSKTPASKEKSDKTFSSFRLLKKDDKKKLKSNTLLISSAGPPSINSSTSTYDSAQKKTDSSVCDSDRETTAFSVTAKASNIEPDTKRKNSASKPDPPQATDTDLKVTSSTRKNSYVSTYHILTGGKRGSVGDHTNYYEVKLGKAESKMDSSNEPIPTPRSYKPTILDNVSSRKEPKKIEEKSIAQEIEEVEKSLFEPSDVSPSSTLEDSDQRFAKEVTSRNRITSITTLSQMREQHLGNPKVESLQATKAYKDEVQPSSLRAPNSPHSDKSLSDNSNVYINLSPPLSSSTKEPMMYASMVQIPPTTRSSLPTTNKLDPLINVSSFSRGGIVSSRKESEPPLIKEGDILSNNTSSQTSSIEVIRAMRDHHRPPSPSKLVPRPLTPDHYAPFGKPSPSRRHSQSTISSNTEDEVTTDDDYAYRTDSPSVNRSTINVNTDGEDASTERKQIIYTSSQITDSWAGSSFDKREHLYKILVIGELGTGKTSIIKRYVHQFFCTHYRATIGVDFALKVLNWDGDTVIRLQLWDIAGQERFGNMTRVYYKQAVGAFIVFDVTNAKTFDAVTKWKTDLDTKVTLPDGSCIPTVLLANKCDQPKEGVVCNPSRMDDFCRERNFVGWFETSAKENINIDEATKFLVSRILNNEREGLMAQDSTDTDKFSVEGEPIKDEEAASRKCLC